MQEKLIIQEVLNLSYARLSYFTQTLLKINLFDAYCNFRLLTVKKEKKNI